MSMTEPQKTALNIYAMVTAGSVLMLIPYSLIPFAGIACLFVGFIAAYIYRARNKENMFLHSHMSYIIRTVWWSSLLLLVGLAVFTSIILSNGDLSMITDLLSEAERGIIPNENDIRMMQAGFVHSNASLITMAAIIGLLPYPVFLAWRMVKGIRLSVRGDAYKS